MLIEGFVPVELLVFKKTIVYCFGRQRRRDLADPSRKDKTKLPSKQAVTEEYNK